MHDSIPYGYCPTCGTQVPVEMRFPRISLALLALMAASIVLTLWLFPRFVLIFIFLPLGFGLWRRRAHCSICGRPILGQKPARQRRDP